MLCTEGETNIVVMMLHDANGKLNNEVTQHGNIPYPSKSTISIEAKYLHLSRDNGLLFFLISLSFFPILQLNTIKAFSVTDNS
jgi:hypothetical protein